MIDDLERLDAPWEPWTPKVGDRVRIRFSAECRGHVEESNPDAERADGAIGTVIEWPKKKSANHPITVAYDAPWWSPEVGATCFAGHWAVIELEPLTADALPGCEEPS